MAAIVAILFAWAPRVSAQNTAAVAKPAAYTLSLLDPTFIAVGLGNWGSVVGGVMMPNPDTGGEALLPAEAFVGPNGASIRLLADMQGIALASSSGLTVGILFEDPMIGMEQMPVQFGWDGPIPIDGAHHDMVPTCVSDSGWIAGQHEMSEDNVGAWRRSPDEVFETLDAHDHGANFLNPVGINNLGNVPMNLFANDSPSHMGLWDSDELHHFSTPGILFGSSSSGNVFAGMIGNGFASLWRAGQFQVVGPKGSIATDVNDGGVAVGSTRGVPVLFNRGTRRPLKDLVRLPARLEILFASAINDGGDILVGVVTRLPNHQGFFQNGLLIPRNR